jgi:hypothetical protein
MAVPGEQLFLTSLRLQKDIEIFGSSTKPPIPSLSPQELHIYWLSTTRKLKLYLHLGLELRFVVDRPTWWTDQTIKLHIHTYEKLQNLERELRYAAQGREFFDLPHVYDLDSEWDAEGLRANHKLSVVVAARILFLVQRGRDGRSTFPANGQLRFDDPDFVTSADIQMHLLPEQYSGCFSLLARAARCPGVAGYDPAGWMSYVG